MQSKKDSMQWIPLWIDKWIFGSTRIELQPDERSVWLDLMALSAKDHGFVRANLGVPYPIPQLAGLLCITEELLNRTIKRCIEVKKIIPGEDGSIFLPSWGEYQLSDRHKRRFAENLRQMTGKTDVMSEKADMMTGQKTKKMTLIGEERIGEDRKEKHIGQKNPPDGFSLFWSSYPKKVKKQNTLKEWEKIKDKPTIKIIVDALNKQIASREQLKQGGKFCPEWQDPERWIKNRRWEDETEVGDGRPPTDEVERRLWEIEQRQKNRNGAPDKNS